MLHNAQRAACGIIGSRLDYCNYLYYGMSNNFQRSQRVQNAAARIVCQAPRRQHHSGDLRKDLHWLPVRGRLDYKIAVLCYKAVKLQQPSYLTGLLSPQTVACSEVIYVRPTVNTVFIDKHCCSSVLMLRPHRLEQSSFICIHC